MFINLAIPVETMQEHKISSIKLYRSLSGKGLKDSKDAIDKAIKENNPILHIDTIRTFKEIESEISCCDIDASIVDHKCSGSFNVFGSKNIVVEIKGNDNEDHLKITTDTEHLPYIIAAFIDSLHLR